MRSPPSYQESLKKVNQLLSTNSAELSFELNGDGRASSTDPVNDDFVERILHFEKGKSSEVAANNRHFSVVNNVITMPPNSKQAAYQKANLLNDNLPFYLNASLVEQDKLFQAPKQPPHRNHAANSSRNDSPDPCRPLYSGQTKNTNSNAINGLSLYDVAGEPSNNQSLQLQSAASNKFRRTPSQSPLKQTSSFFTSEIEKELSNLTLSIEREMEKQQLEQQRQQQEYYGQCAKCSKAVIGRNEACQAMKR